MFDQVSYLCLCDQTCAKYRLAVWDYMEKGVFCSQVPAKHNLTGGRLINTMR